MMSDHLISQAGNSAHLYSHGGHLLCQPLYRFVTVPLVPDGMAIYHVAGSYERGFPARGFIGSIGLFVRGEVSMQGKLLRQSYLLRRVPTAGIQQWREGAGQTPLTAFYQGCYAPSAASSTFCAEAGMTIAAYHFTVPAEYSGGTVTRAALSVLHNGAILEYNSSRSKMRNVNNRPYYAVSAPTNLLPADSDWRNGWVARFGLYPSLQGDGSAPCDMHETATDEVTLQTNLDPNDLEWYDSSGVYWQAGTYSGLYGVTGISYADDGYPVANVPWRQSIAMSDAFRTKLDGWRGGWVVGTPAVGLSNLYDSDNADDYPFFYDTNHIGRWLCVSFGSFSLTVTIRQPMA